MTGIGAFTFVLHSHLPYVRLAGRWPHGEEWIHEAATETYLPLLEAMQALLYDGIPVRLTLGLTPTLIEQLSDPLVLRNLEAYLQQRLQAAEAEMRRHRASNDPNAGHYLTLAEGDYSRHHRLRDYWQGALGGDIIGAFRRLAEQGVLELVASAATHAYLPLLSRESHLRAQIAVGIQSYERAFGMRPTSFWLPECAYRPAYMTDDGRLRPGLEALLADAGIRLTFADAHTLQGGQPASPLLNGAGIGPYSVIQRRYVIPSSPTAPMTGANILAAYSIGDSSFPDALHSSGVACIARHPTLSQQVWSSEIGYPGDFDYREFHKRDGLSGLRYWRVTGNTIPLDQKDLYHPDWAAYKVDQHAEHFSHLVRDLLSQHHRQTGEAGLAMASYDTELFGHWWHEGVDWLSKVLRYLATMPDVEVVRASDGVAAMPPQSTLHLPESSWGVGGSHFTWENADTRWMWPPIHDAEARMERLAARFGQATADEEAVLQQAARELLLLCASDWQFLVTTGQARDYAIQRFNQHLERFNRLAQALEDGTPARALAEEFGALDSLFPTIDYRLFAP